MNNIIIAISSLALALTMFAVGFVCGGSDTLRRIEQGKLVCKVTVSTNTVWKTTK